LDNQYHAACVTYIDILGFRTIVDDVYCGNSVAVKKILDLFISEQGIVDPVSLTGLLVAHKPTVVMSFSDAVIRIADLPPVNPDVQNVRIVKLSENEQEASATISREIHALRKLQKRLATSALNSERPGYPGIFVRGGLTVGEICYDQQEFQVFGPAMNRAVKLEEAAIYPRIIVDPDCLKSHNTVFTAIINSGAIAVASDNHHYIDYFTPECLRSDRAVGSNQRHVTKSRLDFGDIDLVIDKIADCEQLQRMKRALEQRLNTHAGDGERILSKYLWAAERHNLAVKKATDVFNLSRQEADDLLVDI
jgi:hypothetical protein